jgi:hypothetical protein
LEGGREEEEKEGGLENKKADFFLLFFDVACLSLSSFSFSQGKETGKV